MKKELKSYGLKWPCPICGGGALNLPYYTAKDWLVLRCSRCTYAWVVDLEEPITDGAFGWGEEVVIEAQRRYPMYKDRLDRVEKFPHNPKTWLDVGCGGGGLLKCVLDAGYTVEGVEPGPTAEIISRRLGIPVHRSFLGNALNSLHFPQYGVISYLHVLEHARNPAEELSIARRFLGAQSLLVVEVPFFDTIMWKIMRSRHRHFYRDHRSYFNVKSISTLLNKAGFTLLNWASVPYKISLEWMLMRLGNKMNFLSRLMQPSLLKRLISLNTMEYLFVIARKK